MAELHEHEESKVESMMDKISEKIHGQDSSSSSDSDDDKKKSLSPTSIKPKINRIFGREKPVHKVLGGGKLKLCCRTKLCCRSRTKDEALLQVADEALSPGRSQALMQEYF